jgi:ribosomal protein S18 acetylase RimI-like enzyme
MGATEFRAMRLADVDSVAALARAVWNRHYPAIITQAQIDYMLGERYNPARLAAELAMPEVFWELALVDGRLAGFSSTIDLARAGIGGASHVNELKLDKLYVDVAMHRRGLGGALIARAAARAEALGREALVLAVNKRNEKAIAAYRKHGFEVRESVRVDIGQGFVMDDFIMQRTLRKSS